MNSITQNMRFRQSLMKYSEKYGVSKASRKYNKSRSHIYFWKSRWDGSVESLAEKSKRPHHHPNEHTEEEITMIRNLRRRDPELEVAELWHRLKKKGYTRCLESLYCVMKKLGLLPAKKEKKKHVSKPYEQMTHAGERIQVDVKVVPKKCIADPELKLYQYTAIDEYSRIRFLYGYEEQSTYSSADFVGLSVPRKTNLIAGNTPLYQILLYSFVHRKMLRVLVNCNVAEYYLYALFIGSFVIIFFKIIKQL